MSDVKTCHFCGGELGGSYSYYWSNPCHTACLTKTNVKKKDADEITALLARLEAERNDLASALDSIEAEHSISTNGNVWRFWRDQAREMAQKAEKADKAEAALTEAYRMGLEAGAKVANNSCDEFDHPNVHYTFGKIAKIIRALPDKTPAEILAQIQEGGE